MDQPIQCAINSKISSDVDKARPFPILPIELNLKIFKLFDHGTLARISRVCHSWNTFSNRKELWSQLHQQQLDKFYVSPSDFTEKQLFYIKKAAIELKKFFDSYDEDERVDYCVGHGLDPDHLHEATALTHIFDRINISNAGVMILHEYMRLEKLPKIPSCLCDGGLCKLQILACYLWRCESPYAWQVAVYMLNCDFIYDVNSFLATSTRNFNFLEYLLKNCDLHTLRLTNFNKAHSYGVIYSNNIYEHLIYEIVLLCIPSDKRAMIHEDFAEDIVTGSAYRLLVNIGDEDTRIQQVFRMLNLLCSNSRHKRLITVALQNLPKQWPETAENKLDLEYCFFDKLSNIKGATKLFEPLLEQLPHKRHEPPEYITPLFTKCIRKSER